MSFLSFRFRAFVSLSLAVCFALLLVSGVALYLAPFGSIARETGWHFLGLARPVWIEAHILFGALFLFAGLCHLVLNRRALLSYLNPPASKTAPRRFGAEVFIVLFVAGFVFWSAAERTAPIAALSEWRYDLRHPPMLHPRP